MTPQLFHNAAVLTGKDEWYTPTVVIEAARDLMGSIDLDPASCVEANQTVRASTFYTINDDGLQREWRGNTWCNPPFGSGNLRAFHKKLTHHISTGDIPKACFLTPVANGPQVLDCIDNADAIAFWFGRNGWTGSAAYKKRAGRPSSYVSPWNWGPLMIACYGVTIEDTRQAFRHIGVVR